MAVKGKTSVFFFLFVTLVLVSATVSYGSSKRDPEIAVCKQKCEQIKGSDQDVQIGCKKKCEKYFQEKQQREQGHGGRDDDSYNIILAQEEVDVSKMVQECHQSCQGSQGEQQHPYCFKQCMEERFQEQQGRESGSSRGKSGGQRQQQQHQQQSNNPYVFQEQHFTAKLETELGNVRVLQKFTDRSELFNGIEKYRVAFLEAEPQTFIIPNHWDADTLVYVANGEGTISMINQDSRQSNSIKRGDIFRVPAGVSVYLINKHDTERLVLAKIIRSVSVPGELQAFFSVGGDQPESSFFNAFSTEVLEAAFNVDRGSIEKLFGQQQQRRQPRQQQQQQGIFKRATKEQIRSLSDTDESRLWPFGQRKQGGPYNIYKERPSVANENGNLHEVDVNDLSELRDMNVAFSLFNISQGSMVGPIYNAKATVALVITNGQGQFEMACPHLTEKASTRGEFNPTYQKVSSELRKGTVVVIPAGHPFVIEANNQDLEVVSFGMNSDVNEWFPLAGRNNVMTQWEDEAIDLTFGVPAKEVRQVIQKQNQRFFFKGPVRRGRAFA